MDKSESPLGALARGDVDGKNNDQSGLKREQDSVDDFEHLEGEATKRDDFNDSPIHHLNAGAASQSFLDTEREELFVQPPRVSAPTKENLTDKVIDHLADKFTDSESEASVGESPIHRAVPKAEPTLPIVTEALKPNAPSESTYRDPTPVLAPTPTLATPSVPMPTPAPETTPTPAATPAPASVSKPDTEPAAAPVTKPAPTPIHKEEPMPIPKATPSKPEPSPPPASRAPAHVIEAEVIFCQMGLDAWFDPQRLHPKGFLAHSGTMARSKQTRYNSQYDANLPPRGPVESLIYWRDPARSGAALGAGLALLVALACCSVVSVFAYVSLLGLSGAVAFRIYKNVLQAVQKTNEGHPFKWMLEKDISVPAERAQSLAAGATAHLNATTNELRRLFLVEDLVDSLKFGVVLWCLTYVGAYFNGITLIILGWIALFSLPKAYEMNKAQVDANLELARGKINEISAKVRAAVPLGKKSESEKDK